MTTELEQAQAEPHLDPLTKLPNRLGLQRSLDELAEDDREPQGIALLMIDIDRFKGINDSYGHLVGDAVLVEVARIIADCLKPPQIAARLGAEQFVIVIPSAHAALCEGIARRICSQVAHLRISRVGSIVRAGSVSVSIGIAIAQPHESRDQLLRRADDAMYQARHGGGARFIWSTV